MKKILVLIGVVFIMFLMISTATAVPTSNGEVATKQIEKLEKIQNILNILENTKNILKKPTSKCILTIIVITLVLLFILVTVLALCALFIIGVGSAIGLFGGLFLLIGEYLLNISGGVLGNLSAAFGAFILLIGYSISSTGYRMLGRILSLG